MEEISFTGLVVVAAVALLAPLLLGLLPRLRLPPVVLEIVAGIAIGPALLGWVEIDTAIRVFALFGLAFLLFLAGLEIDFERLRGRLLRLAGTRVRGLAPDRSGRRLGPRGERPGRATP